MLSELESGGGLLCELESEGGLLCELESEGGNQMDGNLMEEKEKGMRVDFSHLKQRSSEH